MSCIIKPAVICETATYQPKFKLGQTVNVNTKWDADMTDDDSLFVIGTHLELKKWITSLEASGDSYDNSDTTHTLYLTYYIRGDYCQWSWEESLILYCSNEARGKKILASDIDKAFRTFTYTDFEKFKKEYLCQP